MLPAIAPASPAAAVPPTPTAPMPPIPATTVPTILPPIVLPIVPTFHRTHDTIEAPILSIQDKFLSPPGSTYFFTSSNPQVDINPQGILWTTCSSCPGLLSETGSLDLLTLHILLAGSCRPSPDAGSADFVTVLKLDYLNRLAQELAPGMLAATFPRSFSGMVATIKSIASQLRSPLIIKASNLVLP